MSSCFLCDCSYKFLERDKYTLNVPFQPGTLVSVKKFMKQVPIIIGSSGTGLDDQQHDNSKKQNYFPYRVKKIEFHFSVDNSGNISYGSNFPDYVLIFKVPFRDPIIDYYFGILGNFMLYSEPECVLGYKVLHPQPRHYGLDRGYPDNFRIDINKPFIVGPNEYVGVFYMFEVGNQETERVDASAKVWFDVA